jgi:ZIP family zinc transporter
VEALEAGFYGFVGGASLLAGVLIGLYAGATQRTIGLVMAVGAGVLISSVAFELMDEAYGEGGFDAAAAGLLLGAVCYFGADWALSHGARNRKRSQGQEDDSGRGITIGALMDGIPESVALGSSLEEDGELGVRGRRVPEQRPRGPIGGCGQEESGPLQSVHLGL